MADSDKVSPAHKLGKGEMSATLPFLVFSSLFRKLQSIECSFVLKTPRNRNEAFDTMKRSRYALRSKAGIGRALSGKRSPSAPILRVRPELQRSRWQPPA